MPPSSHARNLRSMLEWTVVTPILNLFPAGNNAEIRAAIDDQARAFSVGDDNVEAGVVDVNIDDGYSYFGDQPNPNPED